MSRLTGEGNDVMLASVPGNFEELQIKIRSKYAQLSKRLQDVAEFTLDNPNVVAFETIATISEQAKVPPSTLVRFAQALGFSGFNDLKSLVKANIVERTSNYSTRIKMVRSDADELNENAAATHLLPRFAKANRDALRNLSANTDPRNLQSAVELLANANHIFILGNGRSHTVATYLFYALNHLDKKVFMIDGTGGMYREQLSNLDKGDVLFAISYSPYSHNTHELAAQAADRGVRVLSISDSPLSPLAAVSNVSFVVKEARVDTFRSLSSSLCLSQVLTLAVAQYHEEQISNN